MKFLITVSLSNDAANESVRSGELGNIIQNILEDVKPEAAYFGAKDGMRTAFLIVDLEEASQIPAVAEPFFLAFNASIDITPVMAPEDLGKAGPAIGNAVKNFG